MNEIKLHRERIKRNILKSFQVDLEKSDFDEFEKAKSGIYQDNAENRRLNRVGQKYGTPGKQEEEGSSLNDHAREASTEALNKVLQSKNTSKEMKNAAEKELKNRGAKNKDSVKQGSGKKKYDLSNAMKEALEDTHNDSDKFRERLFEIFKESGAKNVDKFLRGEPANHMDAGQAVRAGRYIKEKLKEEGGNENKQGSEKVLSGNSFFEKLDEISEDGKDWEEYLTDVFDYIDKYNLGLDDKNQEQDFDKLSLKHKLSLSKKMNKAFKNYKKNSKQ